MFCFSFLFGWSFFKGCSCKIYWFKLSAYTINMKLFFIVKSVFSHENAVYDIQYILFPTELHLKNVYYHYSACSNPTNVVLLIVLSMIIGKGAWYWYRWILRWSSVGKRVWIIPYDIQHVTAFQIYFTGKNIFYNEKKVWDGFSEPMNQNREHL